MEVTSRDFKEKVLDYGKPVLVEFWGSWCLPCKAMDPILKKLSEEFSGKVAIYKVNADRNPGLRNSYDIRGLPTFIIFSGGKEIERRVSARSEDELKALLKKHSE